MQFIRLLNNFEVSLGRSREGVSTLLRVPVYYGDSSRQVASIIARNSENSMPTVPAMTVYIGSLRYDRPRVQEPQHISKLQIRERAWDPVAQQYTDYQGDLLTVERLMPVPYLLTLKVDIWTSNTDQKLQIIEQLAVLFNPGLELQSTDNYVDWTSLTTVTLVDETFSSRTVPVGPEDPIDVATLTFELPIWLSAPARVKKQGVIQRIIASSYDSQGTIDHDADYFNIAASIMVNRQVFTPMDFNVVYSGNTLKLYVSDSQVEFDDNVEPSMTEGNWEVAVRSFGELANAGNVSYLTNGISQIRLENTGITVVGTVSYHPVDPSLLIYTVDTDTLPVNTLTPVDAIIDPWTLDVDSSYLNPLIGARYLILNPIGSAVNDDGNAGTIDGPILWNRVGEPELIANANDIIEWTGSSWIVAFDSAATISVQYVTNLTTSIQYRWQNQEWTRSVEGRYGVGAWSFVPN